MKAALERSALLRTLGHVQSVVERRNTIPILSNVRLSAEGERIHFAATDMEMEVLESAPARIESGGVTTVPAHTLYDIVRKLPDGADVAIEVKGDDSGRLSLTAGRSKFLLPTLPANDFPVMSAEGFACTFSISSAALARLIDKTRFAISTEETRYYLTGIHLHPAERDGRDRLRAVATDGYRLALAETDLPEGAKSLPGIIVPRKTVQEVRRLLEDAGGDVEVAASESKIRFSVGDAVLTSKLVEGSFPDYQKVIPANNTKSLVLENAAFSEAVDRVATISAEKSRSIKLSLDKQRLELTVDNPDTGNATEELAVEFDADPIEIGFNAKYLLDVTGQIEGETAEFLLADPAAPALILDRGDEHAQYVLMPLRV